MSSLLDLSGETAVVLGGTGVLGGAMADALAQAGARGAVVWLASSRASSFVTGQNIGVDGGFSATTI